MPGAQDVPLPDFGWELKRGREFRTPFSNCTFLFADKHGLLRTPVSSEVRSLKTS